MCNSEMFSFLLEQDGRDGEQNTWTSDMAQWVRVPVAKPDALNLILGTHMREPTCSRCPLTSRHMPHTCMHVHTENDKNNKQNRHPPPNFQSFSQRKLYL